MENSFYPNLNSLFSANAPELRFHANEASNGYVIDDNGNIINTFPMLEYEERHVSSNKSRSYTYLSLCSYGQRSEVVCINSPNLFKSSTYIELFGNKPFAMFDKKSWSIFFTIIEVMLLEIEQRMIYEYSGWNQELDKYLFGNLMIEANNVRPVTSTLVKSKTVQSQKSCEDLYKDVDRIAKNIASKPIIGYIWFMYLMHSHCKPRFVQLFRLCPEFLTSIVGGTGSYKTSIAKGLFNTHDASLSSFEDSFASIRRMFQSCKSGVTIVDDYKISSSQNDAKYEKIVRLSGDIQTTGKYVSGNQIVDNLIGGLSLITGEIRPHLQQSSYSRILFTDVEEYPVNLNFLAELQESKSDINSFIVLFIRFVLQTEEFDNEFISSYKKHRTEFIQDAKYKGMHGRYYEMYAWMAAMWDVYEELMQTYGVSTEFDFKVELKSFIYEQHCLYDNNPIKLFKTAYLELISSNEIIITDKKGIDSLNFDVIDFDGELFFKSNSAYKKICKFWQDKGIDFPCKERKLRTLLHEAGILKSKDGHLTTEKKTKDNRSYSGYILFKNFFMNYGGTDNEEP